MRCGGTNKERKERARRRRRQIRQHCVGDCAKIWRPTFERLLTRHPLFGKPNTRPGSSQYVYRNHRSGSGTGWTGISDGNRYAPAPRTMWRRAVGRDARNRGVEPRERVHVLDREVRAQRDAAAVVNDAPEGVETFDALGTLRRRVGVGTKIIRVAVVGAGG